VADDGKVFLIGPDRFFSYLFQLIKIIPASGVMQTLQFKHVGTVFK
jgi:hypothetical protein